MEEIVFLIQRDDSKGLLARISSFFYEKGFNILDCKQHSDLTTNRYFMRVALDANDLPVSKEELERGFAEFADELRLEWSSHYPKDTARTAVLVSKTSHCLYDILVKQREGLLRCEIPLVIGNHPDLEPVAEQFGIPFHHLPVSKETKKEQEAAILRLLDERGVDLVVLARYMRILSPEFLASFGRPIINIHHAFLPAFQGANPYRRAYDRGVKIIGATAHYVTEELDEGPIIEQDVTRVSHQCGPDDLKRIGRDIESMVLSRAVKAHLEHRVIVFANRTVVFSI